jgi:glycosyltransferase involved in cell wall biosynthesis
VKVCFVSHSSAKGGAERVLIELIDALRGRGVECYVIMPGSIGDGSLINELKNRDLIFDTFPYTWWMTGAFPLWKRLAKTSLNLIKMIPVIKKIKRWKCDIIYTNTITVCIGALAAKFLGLPHVWHIHEFGYEDHGLIFDLDKKFSLWLMDRFSSVCIANSKAVAQKYQQYISPLKLKVIYQSVSVVQQANIEKAHLFEQSVAGVRCVIVGALQEGKRQEDAILAIGELVHIGINAELFIVGEGDPKYRKYLYDLVAVNKLNKHIKFVGYVENPFVFMQRADVVLMCSRYEAFGRVTVEAMKLGRPVVGARSGGTTELICDGFNGLLYTPGDYKELAQKIRYLYNNPDVLRQIGENGQRWAVKQFTRERYGDEVLTILRQIVNHKSE